MDMLIMPCVFLTPIVLLLFHSPSFSSILALPSNCIGALLHPIASVLLLCSKSPLTEFAGGTTLVANSWMVLHV